MDSSLLVNLKNQDDMELRTIEKTQKTQNQYLYSNEVIDPNMEFYEYFSSNVTHDSSFFQCENNYDNVGIADEASGKSIYITRLVDTFNQTNGECINHNGDSTSPQFVHETNCNGLSFYNVNRADLAMLESSYHSQNGDGYEKNVYRELYTSEIEPTALESINRRYLRLAFEKWRRKFRLKMVEKEPVDQILSREYYRCKAQYQLQQKNCIASVHFKISILSDSFNKWRLFSIAMHVKRRMQDVARVHYADQTSSHFFHLWRNSLKEKCRQQQKVNGFIVARTFTVWKRWTILSKECSQHKYVLAVEFNDLLILKHAYNVWKEEFLFKKAASCYELHQKKHAFKLWSLQLLKRKLQRRLARSHRIRLCQQKFFAKWKSKLEDKFRRRLLFTQKLHMFIMRCYWERLKKGVKEETIMRASAISIVMLCKKNSLQYFLSLWKHQYAIKCFKLQHQKQNGEYILRVHFEKWKIRRKKLLLIRKMKLWNIIQGKLLSLQYLSRWQYQKNKRELKNQEYEKYVTVIQRNNLARSFSTWRRISNDENTVKCFIHAGRRKVLARCFKLWILVKRRAELLKMQQLNVLNKTFSYWRKGAEERINTRKIKIEKDNNIMQKCVSHWKDYASICKQRRETSVTCFARHWLDVTQQRVMERRILHAQKVSNEIIKKVHFSKWQHQFDAAVRRRLQMEKLADEHYHCSVYSKVFNTWIRQQNINIIVRNYQQEKEKLLLATAFKHWLEVIQQDMQLLLNNFTEKLTISENSLQSSISTAALVNQQLPSPQLNSTLSKTNNTLVNLYKDSIESSLQQQNDTLQLENDTLELHNKTALRENEFSPNSSLQVQKAEPSDMFISNPSFPFSASDMNDLSSTVYNQELLDYNTDNDVDQDQIWEDPTSRSELQLNFSSFHTTISEDNLMQSNNFSFMSSNIHIPRDNIKLPKWIDTWKKRYIHSKILSKKKRYLHGVIAPNSSSSLLPLSGTSRNHQNVKLSLSPDEDGKIPNRNIDQRKVSILVATLKYWKHLDISAVFYAWLEYTQRKKYLRLMQEYLMEKKYLYDMHVVFLEWNRKLYGARAYRYFRQKTLTDRYFGQWMKYHSFQQLKFTRMQSAKEQHKKSVVKSYFQEWKKRCHLEFLLSGVNNSLDNDLEILVNDFTVIKNNQMLENLFQSWKCSTLQMKLSKVHYENRLQIKYLNTWWQLVLEKGRVKLKLKIFQRDHQLKKVFLLWKRRMHYQIRVQQLAKTKETEVMSVIFSQWHNWTKSRLKLRLKGNAFAYKVNYQLIRDAFKEWKLHHKRKVCAIDLHNYVICTKVFSSWRGLTGQRVAYENKVKSFQNKRTKNLMLQSLTCWKQMYHSRLKIKHTNKQKDGNTLSITFKAWKETTLHSKADKQYVDSKFKHVFKSWKEKYVSRNEIQFLAKISCRRWKRLVEKSKSNESILQEYLEQKNLSIKREYFLKWRKNIQVLTISKTHFKGKLLTKAFSAWKIYRKCQIVGRQSVDHIKKKHMNNLVSSYFKIWQENHTRKKALADIKQRLTMIMVKEKAVQWKLRTKENIFSSKNENYLLKKYLLGWSRYCQQFRKAIELDERNKKKIAFCAWKTYKECQFSERQCVTQTRNIHMSNLVSSCFKIWQENHIRKKALADIKRRLTMIMVKEKAIQWKLKTKGNIFSSKNEKNLLEKYFLRWTKNYQLIRKAIQLDERNKMKTCMLYWVRSARRHAEVNTKVDAYIKVKENCMVKMVFLKWHEYKTDSIEAQKLSAARCLMATKHYNKHLVKTFFYKWSMFTKFEKVRKIRDKRIAREYLERWRSNIAAGNIVVSLFEQKMCEIYWRKWRHVYIQQHVLKVMGKRDDRRVISVVFASWNKHTRLKRILPNQMQILQTAVWFRKWKNRCSN